MKKRTKGTVIAISVMLVWNHLPYHYNNEKTIAYVTSHSAPQSRSMCAWHAMKSMWHGGCPIGPFPAYAYKKTMPQMGFEEIPSKGHFPIKGDNSVLPQNKKSCFGHIAIYDRKQWVSGFKQKSLYPNSTYEDNGHEKIFRASDGWHWKHLWTSPMYWYGWMESLVMGFNKIKF